MDAAKMSIAKKLTGMMLDHANDLALFFGYVRKRERKNVTTWEDSYSTNHE